MSSEPPPAAVRSEPFRSVPLSRSPSDAHVLRLRAQIVARLRPVCGELDPRDFEALVRDVLAFRLRWER